MDLGFRVWDFEGLALRVWILGLALRVWGLGFWAYVLFFLDLGFVGLRPFQA